MKKHPFFPSKCWTTSFHFSFLFACGIFFLTNAATVKSAELPRPRNNTPAIAGLVAAYNFDEGVGSTVTDLSGNGNDGMINGASWTNQGRFGNALSFAPPNWITVNDSNSLDLTSGMTLEAWVYPTVNPSTWTTIIFKELPEANNQVYGLYATSPSNLPLVDVFTDSIHELYGTAAVPLNTWTYLAATYDAAGGLTLYVDSMQVAHLPTTGNLVTSIGPLRIGGNSIFGEYFTGIIDNVRIYNRALTLMEVKDDMDIPIGGPTPTPTPSGPCARSPGYWKNHSNMWCVGNIQLGCTNYTLSQAIAILRQNPSRDKTYSLAHQLIAAKLDVACLNTNSSCIGEALSAADAWLCAHPVGSGVTASSAAWQEISATHDLLANYTSGLLCAPSCDLTQ